MAVPILIGWTEDVKGIKTPTTEARRHGEKEKHLTTMDTKEHKGIRSPSSRDIAVNGRSVDLVIGSSGDLGFS